MDLEDIVKIPDNQNHRDLLEQLQLAVFTQNGVTLVDHYIFQEPNKEIRTAYALPAANLILSGVSHAQIILQYELFLHMLAKNTDQKFKREHHDTIGPNLVRLTRFGNKVLIDSEDVDAAIATEKLIRKYDGNLETRLERSTALVDAGMMYRFEVSAHTDDQIYKLVKSRYQQTSVGNRFFYNFRTGQRFMMLDDLCDLCTEQTEERFSRRMLEICNLMSSRGRSGFRDLSLYGLDDDPGYAERVRKALNELHSKEGSYEEKKGELTSLVQDLGHRINERRRKFDASNKSLVQEIYRELHRDKQGRIMLAEEIIGLPREFDYHVQWLRGARIVDAQIKYDNPKPIVREIIKYVSRNKLLRSINVGRVVGRVSNELAHPQEDHYVYLVHVKEMAGREYTLIFKKTKWGVESHMHDTDKSQRERLTAARDSERIYEQFVWNKIRALRILNWNMPDIQRVRLSAPVKGLEESVAQTYWVREFVEGTASNKIPVVKYKDMQYVMAMLRIMGEEAGRDMLLGRQLPLPGDRVEDLFNEGTVIIRVGEDSTGKEIPRRTTLMMPSGSFYGANDPIENHLGVYATYLRETIEIYQAQSNDFSDESIYNLTHEFLRGVHKGLDKGIAQFRGKKSDLEREFPVEDTEDGLSFPMRLRYTIDRALALDPAKIPGLILQERNIADFAKAYHIKADEPYIKDTVA